jgi:hypothetical protein
MDRTEKDVSNDSSFFRVFASARKFLTELLPSKYMGDTHTDTQTDGRDLRSTPFRWGSSAMIYVHKKLMGGYTDTQTDLRSTPFRCGQAEGGIHRHTERQVSSQA